MVTNNKQHFRFEIALPDNEVAYVEYRWLKGSIVLMHTLVPSSARGKGTGGLLVKSVLDHIRKHGLKMIVYCPFVSKYLELHPEYEDLLNTPNKK